MPAETRVVPARVNDNAFNNPEYQHLNAAAGKVHQGLNPANRCALLTLLQPLASKKMPIRQPATSTGGRPPGGGRWGEGVTADEMADYTWPRHDTEAQIKFTEWTAGGLLRHAQVVSLREM